MLRCVCFKNQMIYLHLYQMRDERQKKSFGIRLEQIVYLTHRHVSVFCIRVTPMLRNNLTYCFANPLDRERQNLAIKRFLFESGPEMRRYRDNSVPAFFFKTGNDRAHNRINFFRLYKIPHARIKLSDVESSLFGILERFFPNRKNFVCMRG